KVTDKIFRHRAFGVEAQPCARENLGLNAHRDVCGDRHFKDDAVPATVFGNVGNAVFDRVAGSTYLYAFPIHQNFAGIGRSNAKENAGKFGATCADKTGNAKNFAGAKLEADVCDVGGAASEVLDDEGTWRSRWSRR